MSIMLLQAELRPATSHQPNQAEGANEAGASPQQ